METNQIYTAISSHVVMEKRTEIWKLNRWRMQIDDNSFYDPLEYVFTELKNNFYEIFSNGRTYFLVIQ